MYYISKFYIENFKCFSQATFHDLNHDLNILTGVNNSGKTTVLEAIALWNECFNHLIFQVKRADNKLGLKSGYYRFYSNPKETSFAANRVISLNIPSYESLFHNLEQNNLYLETTISKNHDNMTIGFKIKTSRGHVYIITLGNHEKFDYPKFNQFFDKFPYPINVVSASSIASLKTKEPYETEPKIDKKISSRKSIQVLRNRLYWLYYRSSDHLSYASFIEDLKYILLNKQADISFEFLTEHQTDIFVIVNIKMGNSTPLDISLLGSGTLQIIEILLSCYEKSEDLGIILLDEPDSHIHRDIQKRLLNILIKHADRKQIFLTTHNESLIRSAKPHHLFHLRISHIAEYRPIISYPLTSGAKRGLQPSHQIKILESLGSESALDYLNAIEADKLIMVEGRNDAQYIQTILRNYHQIPDNAPNVMFWAFGGIDEIISNIKAYQHFLTHIKNKQSLWDKTVLVFDKDNLTSIQRQKLMIALTEQFNINVYIWNAYTIEATILTDIPNFIKLIEQYAKYLDKHYDFTFSDLQTIVQEKMAAIIAEKKQQIGSDGSRHAVFHYLRTRREKLKTCLEIKGIMTTDDGSLANQSITEAIDTLTRGELYPFATKNDIDKLIKNIFTTINIPLSKEIDSYFIELLTLAKYSPWFTEWDNMIQTIFNLAMSY